MSIRELAAQTGVSITTVSRVFNMPEKVNAETRAHILEVAQVMGYLPNGSARSLRMQRSRVLGVVLPTLLNPVFAECLDGIAQAANEAGYAMLPMTTDYQLEREDLAIQQLLAGNVDGLVLVVSNPDTSGALLRLRAHELPYVLAYNRHPDHPCVSVDNELAMQEVVAQLTAFGHRRIALITGKLAASDRAQQRQRGFVAGAASPRVRRVAVPGSAVCRNRRGRDCGAFAAQSPTPPPWCAPTTSLQFEVCVQHSWQACAYPRHQHHRF